ncbi:phosphomannomutase [Morganella morganii]|uniref:phosphomannomutase n=1 Tax=Morganella morganii TaxID=582 RepID=UPI0009BE5046|nr:phosphomannomutase [Morganella morganii]EBQ6113506.1 phosphomannomutase CpsG [Salmonella enterica subsp. enterica serovar Enteritidis]OQP28315.1 phosphomannomutase [Morganella morganii]OQP30222.1 phosphomannomutase [Morganella morganii]
MSHLTCFKAYDIRGQIGNNLNEDIAYRIGRAYCTYLSPSDVVVGCDCRNSSEALKHALIKGITDSGCNVIDIGIVGTEEVYFATSYLNADGGIEITASHNPIDYNGMKLVREKSKPISGDTGLNEIKLLAEKNLFPDSSKKGLISRLSNLSPYVDHLFSYLDSSSIKPLKLVINSGNGVAGHVVDEIEKRFQALNIPISVTKLFNNPDGNFPNGIPNPLLPECRKDTQDAVIQHKADIGIAFDGDFDRCFFFDENGTFIEGYYIVGMLAEAFLQKEPGAKIIHDPRLSWNTIDIVNKSGGIPVLSKTGHAFIKEKMRKEDAIYGGEMSAHHYFRDFSYCDSGMIPWLLVIELLSKKAVSLSQLVKQYIADYPASGEINSVLDDPNKSIVRVTEYFQNDAITIDMTDGISMEFNEWRFNLRCSNTEPVVRLNVESRADIKLMHEKTKLILDLLRK